MADYRISIYLGAGEDGEKLRELIKEYGARDEFMRSQMEFVRHCIRFTIEHDPKLRRVPKP